MTIQRARVIKGAFSPAPLADGPRRLDATCIDTPAADTATAGSAAVLASASPAAAARVRRIAAEILDARAEAARILAEARQRADAAVAAAVAAAREEEVAKLAAGFLALRDEDARRAERDVDRVIELAVILAERLIGEALRVEPARIAELAAAAIHEARSARRVRIDASPDDVAALEEALGAIGQSADVRPDPTLDRGSLVVHSDLARVDAHLRPQLTRLAEALREVLR